MARKGRTRGQVEAEVSDGVTRFEKEYMGRGPLETRTHLVEDMVIVRMKGVLTKAELKLIRSERTARGRDLIKQVRVELIENGRAILEAIVRSATKRKVRSLHTDISTVHGERILVFVLDRRPELDGG